MCGHGAIVFAVFTYAIVNARPDMGSMVSLSPIALSGILGEDPKDIEEAIRDLCAPDKESRSDSDQGRRLVRIGHSMDYKVVNLEKYRYLDSEDQKTYWRERKREQRQKSDRKSLTDTSCLGHVEDKIGHVPVCPHADADTKANADTNKKGISNGESPLKLTSAERIGLEKERKRVDERVQYLKKNEFRTPKQTQEMTDGRIRVQKIDAALHIKL